MVVVTRVLFVWVVAITRVMVMRVVVARVVAIVDVVVTGGFVVFNDHFVGTAIDRDAVDVDVQHVHACVVGCLLSHKTPSQYKIKDMV